MEENIIQFWIVWQMNRILKIFLTRCIREFNHWQPLTWAKLKLLNKREYSCIRKIILTLKHLLWTMLSLQFVVDLIPWCIDRHITIGLSTNRHHFISLYLGSFPTLCMLLHLLLHLPAPVQSALCLCLSFCMSAGSSPIASHPLNKSIDV